MRDENGFITINSLAELIEWMKDDGCGNDEINAIVSIFEAGVKAERERCAEICVRFHQPILAAEMRKVPQ